MSNGTLSNLTDSDPTSVDDTSKGFTAGSTWTNTATNEVFECVDASLSDATWRRLSPPPVPSPTSSIPQVPSHVVAEAVSRATKPLDTVTGTFRASGNYRVTVDDITSGMLRSTQDSGHETGAETPPSVRKDGEMADNLGVAAPVLPVVTTVDRCAPTPTYWRESDNHNDDMIADGFQHVLRGQTDINNNVGATGQRVIAGQRITDGLVTSGTDAVLHGQAGINENVGSGNQRVIAGQRITDAELSAGFQNSSNGQRHTDGIVTSGVNHLSNEHMELAEGQRFTDRAVQDGTQAGLTGQRFTDARVADGVQGLGRQINQDAMFLDAEASRNAQFLGNQMARGHEHLQAGQGATDRNVDANGRYLAEGQRVTDANVNQSAWWVAREVDDVERDVNASSRWLGDGQRHTDANVNGNARWLDGSIDNVDRDVNQGFRETERGQRHTDEVVNDNGRWLERGQRDIHKHLGETERHLDREIDDVDSNVSDSARWLHTGQDANARWLHSGQDANAWRLAQQAGADTRFLHEGQDRLAAQAGADTRYLDGNIDAGRRETAHGFGHTNEHLANAERRIENRIGDKVSHVGEENAEAFGALEKDLCDTERRIENTANHNTRYLGDRTQEGERRLHNTVDGAERRIEGTVRHVGEETQEQLGDAERRIGNYQRESERRGLDNVLMTQRNLERDIYQSELRRTKNADDAERRQTHNLDSFERRSTKNLDDSERRIEHTIERNVTHNLEELSEALSDHDRRASERLIHIADDVRHQGEKTRERVEKVELESRLYLRDREDRTHDLVRALADRNLDEMRGFERRSRDDEDRTRALIRHETEERHEREFALGVARNTRLQNKLDIVEALEAQERERRWCDRDRDRRGGGNIYFDPNINVRVDDVVDDRNFQAQSQRQRQRQWLRDDDIRVGGRGDGERGDRGMTV